MKILHVTNAVGWSGGCQQLTTLIEGLKRKGHESTLVCPPISELIRRIEKSSVQFQTCSMFQDYDLRAALFVRKVIQQTSPDIVHAHHPMAHAISLVALSMGRSVPFVVSRRVSFKVRGNIFSLWKYRSRKISKYVAVSSAIKETLMKGGVHPDKIEVIYSAYDADKFRTQIPNEKILKELKVPSSYKIVGKVANFSLWKGQKLFLEAAKKVLQENRNILFVLVGKDTEQLQESVQQMGIRDSVRMLGFRRDIPQILSTFNLSVNSAIEGEGLSGAMRESLAMQIPVVATDVSGNREIVQEGVTGLLVPKNDPDTLSKKILYALNNESSMKEMAKRGFNWVQNNCSLETMISKHIQIYEGLRKCAGFAES